MTKLQDVLGLSKKELAKQTTLGMKVDMLESLRESIMQAGGKASSFDMDMSVRELIETLAPNGVRFICLKGK